MKKILGIIASVIIVVGIFVFAIPKFADYSAVWAAIERVTPLRDRLAVRGDDLQPFHVLVGEHKRGTRDCDCRGRRPS